MSKKIRKKLLVYYVSQALACISIKKFINLFVTQYKFVK
ncbi:hypothetical protein MC28_E140 (plasmid) [Bacillus thuringiensis MC28]|nr:hypothetical protein MC28_E140 [Bacillus thuringiensis MC28]